MLLSVIIPCYNVEKYIDECLKSVYSSGQIEDTEVIVVDDGSTDKTNKILKDWCKKYNNIILLEQENSGVSAARNNALDIAKGDYIWFIDGDDAVFYNSLQLIVNTIKEHNPEIVGFYKNIIKINNDDTKTYTEALTSLQYEMVASDIAASSACFCVFKKSDIRFNPSLKFGEDIFFCYLQYLCLSGSSIGCVNITTTIYCYRNRPNSAMHSADAGIIRRHTEDLFLLGNLYKQKIENNEIKDVGKLENTKLRQYGAIQGGLSFMPKSDLNLNSTLKALKKEGLYPYPLITWPFKEAKSIKSKIAELIKMSLKFEVCYRLYYKIRKRIH